MTLVDSPTSDTVSLPNKSPGLIIHVLSSNSVSLENLNEFSQLTSKKRSASQGSRKYNENSEILFHNEKHTEIYDKIPRVGESGETETCVNKLILQPQNVTLSIPFLRIFTREDLTYVPYWSTYLLLEKKSDT